MMIPEFILRKLFVKDSLKKDGEGFGFAVNNTFSSATLLSFGLDIDGIPVNKDTLFIGAEGGSMRTADTISEKDPMPLSIGIIYAVRCQGSPGKGRLTLKMDTKEAGELVFTVVAYDGAGENKTGRYLRIPSFLIPALKAEVEIDVGNVKGEINPFVYGHFIEHLEQCVYGGIWTRNGSVVRRDALELIKAIKPPVVRYPGGNFASGYHWEDGIGPREKRPVRTDEAWQSPESNLVGTGEYMEFCRMTGAEPFLVINDGNGTPEEAARWVAYCNEGKDGEQGRRRAENGHPKPYNVRIWGAGNEVWGRWQIGHASPEEYAVRLMEYAAAMRRADPDIHIVAVGDKVHTDSEDDPGYIWNRIVLERAADVIDSISFHIYHPENEGWKESYERKELYKTVCAAPLSAERVIERIAGQIKKYAPEKNIGVTFDEWNLWLPPKPGASSMHDINYCMRDALYCASMLNVFQRRCEDLFMANLAQLVNVLPAIITSDTAAMPTAIYFPFLMYTRMQKHLVGVKTYVRTFDSGSLGNIEAFKDVPYLDATATRSPNGRKIAIGLVNRHPGRRMKIAIRIRNAGPGVRPVRINILSAETPLSVNSFERPDTIRLSERYIKTAGESFAVEIPACSVTVID